MRHLSDQIYICHTHAALGVTLEKSLSASSCNRQVNLSPNLFSAQRITGVVVETRKWPCIQKLMIKLTKAFKFDKLLTAYSCDSTNVSLLFPVIAVFCHWLYKLYTSGDSQEPQISGSDR